MKRKVLIPAAVDDITSLGGKSVDGLLKLEATLEVKHSTAEIVKTILDAMVKAQAEYQTAKAARSTAVDAQNNADAKAVSLLTLGREMLKPNLGVRYSLAWNPAGFFNSSLAIPRSLSKHEGMLQSMELYFEAHPELEAPGVMTHTILGDARTALSASITAVNAAGVEQREKKGVRDEAAKGMADRLRALHKELTLLMPANDPRWLDFGFDVPADVRVTNAPEGLKLTVDAAGHLVASWNHTVNAVRYRLYKKVAGTDTEFKPVDTTTDTSFDLGTFASGAHVDVQVTAINSAGESVPSHTAAIVVP